ncbi:hypothetical protein HOO65_110063 [Ceratocystis lukuohia]|uniref:Secreted protein n=1 Tax=Ceratocystis lukuohia TaxID=2019550 RepID=A0ABR4M8J6_9PEZI
MQLFTSFKLVFMAALFSTQAIAGDQKVPTLSNLGLEITELEGTSLKCAKNSEGFFAQVYVTAENKAIEVEVIKNPKDSFKSYEAVLSIWKDQSKLDVGSLKQIKYSDVQGDDFYIIDAILKKSGYDPNGEWSHSGRIISKDSPTDTKAWNLLCKASFAKDAMEMCAKFEGMEKLYVESFQVGRDDGMWRWVKIKFATTCD